MKIVIAFLTGDVTGLSQFELSPEVTEHFPGDSVLASQEATPTFGLVTKTPVHEQFQVSL